MDENASKLALSVEETYTALGISRAQLYRIAGAGHLVPRKLGKRTVFLVRDVETYANGLPAASIAPDARTSADAA